MLLRGTRSQLRKPFGLSSKAIVKVHEAYVLQRPPSLNQRTHTLSIIINAILLLSLLLLSQYAVVTARLCKRSCQATRGYVIYSPKVQPEVNESNIREVPKTNKFMFQIGEVSARWRKTTVSNNYSHVFNLSDFSVVFEM